MSNVLVPLSILEISPSRQDGISELEEILHRALGCELIQESGILLRFPQVVMVTAQNVFHRFYYRKSLLKYDVFTVAMGCTILAAKLEEKQKLLREVLFVYHHIYQKRKQLKYKPLDIGSRRYTLWKNELIFMESYILKELGFSLYSVTAEHPHKYILYYVKMLQGSEELSQKAWNYLNDSMRRDLALRYKPQVIACAAIYMAARVLQHPLPSNFDWLEVMDTDIKTIHSVCNQILELYHMPKLQWLEPLAETTHLSPEACAEYDEPRDETSIEQAPEISAVRANGSNADCIDNKDANESSGNKD